MARALILGGTGSIGRAIARRLIPAGWRVDLAARNPDLMPAQLLAAGARFIPTEREEADQLRAAVGAGADLLVDCVCYTAAQARGMLPYLHDAGAAVVVSTKAVYVDAYGNHPNSTVAPRFDAPIREDQPTMAPGDGEVNSREGYGANKVAMEQVLLDSGLPVTIIRPSKVYGSGARRPREWAYVKRVLDGRPVVLLANGGAGGDHPSAALNIAALVEVVAARPGQRILNCADPDRPGALEISRAIATHLGYRFQEVLLDAAAPPGLGRSPWDLEHPLVLDTSAAVALGYTPVGGYAVCVTETVDSLVSAARGLAGAEHPPDADDEDFAPLFDYAAEDAFLAARS